MIKEVVICEAATFRGSGHVMGDLAPLNIAFGANGVGKTTVSRVIANPERFPGSTVSWTAHQLETFVFNRDFVQQNFSQSTRLNGVFTLGQEQVDTLTKIEEAKSELAALERGLRTRRISLEGADGTGGIRGQQQASERALEGRCWAVKGRHDTAFKSVFKGFRGSRNTFLKRVLTERRGEPIDTPDLEQLKQEVKAAFDTEPVNEPLLPGFDASALIDAEKHPLLSKRVSGRDDIEISELINLLGNSDWVRRGREYLTTGHESTCPFCQQAIPEAFLEDLEAYFDESYTSAVSNLRALRDRYSESASTLGARLDAELRASPRFLDVDILAPVAARFKTTAALNLERLATKLEQPSATVELEPVGPIASGVTSLFNAANESARAHNRTVANLEAKRAEVDRRVWRYLIQSELAEDLKAYDESCVAHEKGIAALGKDMQDARDKKMERERHLQDLERKVTSTRPTVIAMNRLLESLGLSSFSFQQAEDEKSYRLVREDGRDASETLSEGERSFVTFLYFYHLIRGSASASGVQSERVVVFDDPVSSLDSDVLFFVSMLIRGVFDEVRRATGAIRQVFVLTHNAYFHREVTFDPRRAGSTPRNDETFWIIRKVGADSQIVRQATNPVRTAYDLLWEDLRSPRQGSATLQNTLRRILENYFKILGGIDPKDVVAKFEGQDQIICRSLISWANAGSHFAMDDLYIAPEDNVELYVRVFREIFEKSGHGGHYRMMMREAEGGSPGMMVAGGGQRPERSAG